jgi:hypothetical protein
MLRRPADHAINPFPLRFPDMPDREPRIGPPLRVLIAEDEAIVSYSVAEDLAEFG